MNAAPEPTEPILLISEAAKRAREQGALILQASRSGQIEQGEAYRCARAAFAYAAELEYLGALIEVSA